MDQNKRAVDERAAAQKPRKRRWMGQLSPRMERAMGYMLAGWPTLRWLAEEIDVPESTLRRWRQPGHPFREEYDRQVRLRREQCEAAVVIACSPKASDWTKLQALDDARELLRRPRSPGEQRVEEIVDEMVRRWKANGRIGSPPWREGGETEATK
jgi:hypothetical protein